MKILRENQVMIINVRRKTQVNINKTRGKTRAKIETRATDTARSIWDIISQSTSYPEFSGSFTSIYTGLL